MDVLSTDKVDRAATSGCICFSFTMPSDAALCILQDPFPIINGALLGCYQRTVKN